MRTRARPTFGVGVLLPPVVVPLPPDTPAPEAPSRRDPTGATSTVDVAPYAGEAKDAVKDAVNKAKALPNAQMKWD